MKKYEVIEKLHTLPGNPEVLIANWAKNLADGEGAGMYPFDITLEPNANHEEDPENHEPNFIALSFDDDDRNEDGNLIEVEEIRLEALQVEAPLKEQIEGYREALKQIEQFSDVGSAELAISKIKAIADNALNVDTNFTPANHLLKQNILERIKQINTALEQLPNGRGVDNLKNLKMILDMALEESGIPNPAIKLWIPIADSQTEIMTIYGVYEGSINEGGGVSDQLYKNKEDAIKECEKRFRKYKREDSKSRKRTDPNDKYMIEHYKKYKWLKKADNYYTNTSDCIALQEFTLNLN